MGWIIALAVLLVIVIAVIVICMYNSLVKYRHKVDNAWANVDVQLQRRFDLIPNLVEIVQSFSTQEMRIMSSLLDARQWYKEAVSNKEKLAIGDKLATELKDLYTQLDKFPGIKSDEHFLQLQKALTEVEEDISYARQFYNDATTMYNNKVLQFPGNIVASIFGFDEEKFYASAGATDAPQIKIKPYIKHATCPQCGAPVPEGVLNCTHCNYKLI